MTDLLLVLPLVLLSFGRDWEFDDYNDKIVGSNSNLTIASDSSFNNKTNEFNAGQTVYVRVTSDVSGTTKRELNLRDNTYKLITTYGLSSIGGNQYTASFAAPNSAGFYSLEARLESGSSVVNLVQTIEVEGDSANSSVSVKIDSEVNTGNQEDEGSGEEILGETSEETSPSVEASPSNQPTKNNFWVLLWKEILEFFAFLSFRTRLP